MGAFLAFLFEIPGAIKAIEKLVGVVQRELDAYYKRKQSKEVREGLERAEQENDTRDLERAFNPNARLPKRKRGE